MADKIIAGINGNTVPKPLEIRKIAASERVLNQIFLKVFIGRIDLIFMINGDKSR
jgi:hypothetical protein